MDHDEDEEQPQMSKLAFIEDKIQMFEGLLTNNKASVENKLAVLKESVEETNEWLSNNLNGG